MFVEHKEQGEAFRERGVKQIKLSEEIRKGCPWVVESRLHSGCAIGTAYKSLTGRDLSDDWVSSRYSLPENLVADAFGVPYRIVSRVSMKHFTGQMTREQCADWLEAQGY